MATRPGPRWLTPAQHLLLRASLGSGDDAREAFDRWARSTALMTIDRGSTRLLPLLWHNLVELGVQHPMLPRLKGIYRHTWFGNQAVLERIRPVLEELDRRGVPAILLKGIPLAHRDYANPGLRPMDDVDVLVHPADAAVAATVVRGLGWVSDVDGPERLLRVKNGIEFRLPRSGERLDLHGHLFTPTMRSDIDARRWARAVPMTAAGLPFRALDPTDRLLHVVVHGALSHPPALRWFADATVVVRRAGASIDWDRLVADAEDEGYGMIVARGLRDLVDLLDVPVPAPTLRDLERRPRSLGEHVRYQLTTQPHVFVVGRIARRYAHYRGWRRGPEPDRRRTGFLTYLQHVWEVEDVRQMPAQLVHHAVGRFRLDVARARGRDERG